MPIKDLEKLRKKTLRERTYEEVVPLIVTGELPSGGWVDEKQVIDKLRVKRPSIALAYMKDNLDHAVASEFLNSMDQEAKKWSGHRRPITRRRSVPSSTNANPHSVGNRIPD